MIYDRDSTDEPNAADLAAIEDEWPLIEAEIELLDVQLVILDARRPVDEVTARRLHRARDAVVGEALRYYTRRVNAARRAA